MNADCVQVAVVGGGPGAISAALDLLRGGISVCMLAGNATRSLPGEVLSPEACAAINALGISRDLLQPFSVPLYGLEAKWGTETPIFHSFLTNPLGNALVVDRQALHLLLRRFALSAGLDIQFPARFLSAERIQNRWIIKFESGEYTKTLESDFLIDATGRESVVARHLGMTRSRVDSLCGVAAVVKASTTKQLLVNEATDYGWWYSVPLFDERMMLCLLSDVDIIRSTKAHIPTRWLELLRSLTLIDSATLDIEEVRAFPCETAALNVGPIPAFLAIGDANASFDPLSSTGVLKAIQSGGRAASAVVANLNDDDDALVLYGRTEHILYERYLIARQSQYSQVTTWKDERFWQRRQRTLGNVQMAFAQIPPKANMFTKSSTGL